MGDTVPSPKAILRGHKAQIHAATFIRGNKRLITGDAEGYVVLWDLTIMRPRAVWRPHENAILGIAGWGDDKIITHGRDHKLIAWSLSEDDEENLSKKPPVEDVATPRPQPWMLHILEVNTMNFCSFTACPSEAHDNSIGLNNISDLFVAVPNTLKSEAIDIYSLPSQERLHTIFPGDKNGMVMSLAIFHKEDSLFLVAAFENGYATVHRLEADSKWIMTYRSQPHSQPILSLEVHPSEEYFITTGADSIIAKHPIPLTRQEVATPPESNERVVDVTAMLDQPTTTSANDNSSSLREWKDPIKVINTKHSGQQSLKIRSDGRIFATAGWDSKARVYSCKTLKELAVLDWHNVGCYAVAFSDIVSANERSDPIAGRIRQTIDSSQASLAGSDQMAVSRESRTMIGANTAVKHRRVAQANTAHWIAAGAKDGKVSLWDIY